jgi:hypothetical protein
LPAGRADEKRVAGREVEDGRVVRKIARPVGPAGDESRKFAECALTPDVEAAFLRVTRGKLHHGKRERKIERAPGDQPDYNGACADGGGSGDPAQADAGDDVEENEVAEAHRAAGAIRGGRLRHWLQAGLDSYAWHMMHRAESESERV